MHATQDVTVRSREDGVVELVPRLAPADGSDRVALEGTVLLVSGGLFLSGLMPALALAAIASACIAGEVFLGLKALVLALRRPAASVHEVERWVAGRR